MSEPKITFFDISSLCNPKACSPSTWKTRLALNYKQIPYKTVWVPFCDIEDTVKKIGGKPTGVKPNKGGNAPLYTLPAILDESGETPVVVTESFAIAEYLDEKYPDRPVLPKSGRALQHIFERFFRGLVGTSGMVSIVMGHVPEILDARSKSYFKQTREDWYGIKTSEVILDGPVRDGYWDDFANSLGELANVLDKNGPDMEWVAGSSEPTCADFIIVSALLWIKTLTPDEWEKKVKPLNGGRWDRLLKKTEVWQAVN